MKRGGHPEASAAALARVVGVLVARQADVLDRAEPEGQAGISTLRDPLAEVWEAAGT